MRVLDSIRMVFVCSLLFVVELGLGNEFEYFCSSKVFCFFLIVMRK